MDIIIVGNGAWGKAVATLLRKNGHKVSFWQEGEIIPDNTIVFSAIPTQVIREVFLTVGKPANLTFINGSKGIERETHKLPYQIIKEVLGENINYFSLMGPSFAEEVVKEMPTLVNLGYVGSKKEAIEIKKLFQTDYFRVRMTQGIDTIELAAAFKNVYAIACGMTNGLGYGMNTRVNLILLAMEEFNELSDKLGYKIEGKALPATIGDLILTCSSEESRNFTFGELLVTHSIKDSLELVKETVEGFYTVLSVPYFEKETGINLPLAHFVYDITHGEATNNMRARFNEFVKSV